MSRAEDKRNSKKRRNNKKDKRKIHEMSREKMQ